MSLAHDAAANGGNRRRLTIGQLLKPHRSALWLGLFATFGESVTDALQPWPIKVLLDNVLGGKPLHIKFIAEAYRVGKDPVHQHHLLLWLCVAVIVIAVLDAICTYGEKYVTTSVGQWVTHDLRRRLYAQVQRLSLSYHDQSQTGDLISRVTSDIDSVQSFIVSGLLSIVVDVMTLLVMIVVMFYTNWRLTLVALAVVPALFFVVYNYTRNVKKASREVRKREGRMISVVQEVLSSIRVVKAFSRERYELKRLEGESLRTVEAALAARKMKSRLTPIVTLITAAGTCGVLYFGGLSAIKYGMTGGTIFLFLAYISKMYKPMQDLSKIMDTYSKADIGYERIMEVIGNDNELHDDPHADNLPPVKGAITFEHVDFWYREEQPVLRDINLHVEPGTTVALVGPTGSGKTTIVNLLARFYDPVHGRITIDGMDIREVRQASLRNQISFVLQDTVLFSGTIWDNIAYGKPKAKDSEVIAAAEAANALEFINKLPDRFDAVVGERGVSLSGGQRQRIAIARAIIRNSPILVLDEPTAALDAGSEQLVFDALDKLKEGRTSIVIAHRLSTIRSASNIFVVRDGQIVESGSHDELIHKEDGVYKGLHDIQFGEKHEEMLTM